MWSQPNVNLFGLPISCKGKHSGRDLNTKTKVFGGETGRLVGHAWCKKCQERTLWYYPPAAAAVKGKPMLWSWTWPWAQELEWVRKGGTSSNVKQVELKH